MNSRLMRMLFFSSECKLRRIRPEASPAIFRVLVLAEKGQDALPDCGHHQLPGPLHLDGGAAHRLLPVPVLEVSFC